MKKIIAVCVLVLMLFALSACAGSGGNGKAAFGETDLIFTLNGNEFALDSDVSGLLRELGDEYSLSEAPSCLYDGTDKTYEYEEISIYTYPLNGKDLIDEIQLTGSSFKTAKGITIGSTRDDIVNAYGEDFADEGGIITYSLIPGDANSPCLYFTVEDGLVTGISYYSASNM